MSTSFETYKPRNIKFCELIPIGEWAVKSYKITKESVFRSNEIYLNALKHLPIWLKSLGNSELPNYKQAFLIVHEAREGVWILLNWWTGGEMIETKVYFSSFETPKIITDSPYKTNSLLCVWELEIFAHEREAWIKNILKNASNPDFDIYKSEVLNT